MRELLCITIALFALVIHAMETQTESPTKSLSPIKQQIFGIHFGQGYTKYTSSNGLSKLPKDLTKTGVIVFLMDLTPNNCFMLSTPDFISNYADLTRYTKGFNKYLQDKRSIVILEEQEFATCANKALNFDEPESLFIVSPSCTGNVCWNDKSLLNKNNIRALILPDFLDKSNISHSSMAKAVVQCVGKVPLLNLGMRFEYTFDHNDCGKILFVLDQLNNESIAIQKQVPVLNVCLCAQQYSLLERELIEFVNQCAKYPFRIMLTTGDDKLFYDNSTKELTVNKHRINWQEKIPATVGQFYCMGNQIKEIRHMYGLQIEKMQSQMIDMQSEYELRIKKMQDQMNVYEAQQQQILETLQKYKDEREQSAKKCTLRRGSLFQRSSILINSSCATDTDQGSESKLLKLQQSESKLPKLQLNDSKPINKNRKYFKNYKNPNELLQLITQLSKRHSMATYQTLMAPYSNQTFWK